MEDKHRKKIVENLDKLVHGVSVDVLLSQLVKKKMFNEYMVNEIMQTGDREKLEYLYWYITTRGPTAFDTLCDTLKEMGRSDLANLLTSKGPNTVKVFQNGNSSNQPSLLELYPDNEEWTVTQGSEEFDLDCTKVYRMRSKPRGLALVINIRKYVNDIHEERLGSEKDVARLQKILPQLGYEVILRHNLKADEIRDAVYLFSLNKKHSQCDSAMVIVMAHGEDQQDGSNAVLIQAWDGSKVNENELVNMMSARLCEGLRGKPKIFFFQMCRGKNYNYPLRMKSSNGVGEENRINVANGKTGNGHTEVNGHPEANGHSEVEDAQTEGTMETDGKFMGKADMIRSDSDILIGHATSPGNVAWRDPENGSWYIQTLCRVLARDAWNDDLLTMLQTVKQERNRLELDHDIHLEEILQGFNKYFYFQPGIRSDCNPIIEPFNS